MVNRFMWTFTLQSYNYLLHTFTPHKLKTSSSLSCNPAPGLFLVIPSPVVFCLSAVSVYFSHSLLCTRSVLSRRRILTLFLSSSNPLNVALRVPSREHLVEQFIFVAVMHTTLSLLREQKFT
jgi:hypothetical protein